MKRICLGVACSAALFVGQNAVAGTINYVGSSTVGKFMHEAAQVYTAASFNINTKPESGGGENATASGACDLGGVARDVKPEILNQGVQKFLIGKDVSEQSTRFVVPVKNSTIVSKLSNVISGRKPCRTGSDYGYFLSRICLYIRSIW